MFLENRSKKRRLTIIRLLKDNLLKIRLLALLFRLKRVSKACILYLQLIIAGNRY